MCTLTLPVPRPTTILFTLLHSQLVGFCFFVHGTKKTKTKASTKKSPDSIGREQQANLRRGRYKINKRPHPDPLQIWQEHLHIDSLRGEHDEESPRGKGGKLIFDVLDQGSI